MTNRDIDNLIDFNYGKMKKVLYRYQTEELLNNLVEIKYTILLDENNLSKTRVRSYSLTKAKEYIYSNLLNLNYLRLCLDRGHEKNEKLFEIINEIEKFQELVEKYYKFQKKIYNLESTTPKEIIYINEINNKFDDINTSLSKIKIGVIPRLQKTVNIEFNR